MPALINQLLNDEFIALKMIFWTFICGVIHGFDGTQQLFVMARHFKYNL